MSWSLSFAGQPEKIVEALDKMSEALTGASKIEFDAALPHMKGILALNHNVNTQPVMKISANGHGHTGYNSCNITIEPLNVTVV